MTPPRDTAADLRASARLGRQAILAGILANAVLAMIKIAAGFFGRSQALIADGLESALDVISSSLIWGALKYAERPPDREHPYGHGKMESLAAIAGAVILVFAGASVAAMSIAELIRIRTGQIAEPEVPAAYTLVVLILVIVVKEGMFRFISKRGRAIESQAMETDAWHNRSDALTSGAAFLGISAALIGGPAWAEADKWAALFSCMIIAFNGIRMLRASMRDALDTQGSEALVAEILRQSCEVDGVESAEKVRVRRSGLTRIADLHVRVNGQLTVQQGHDISHRVMEHLQDSGLNLSDVTVHIEPEPPSSEAPTRPGR